MSRTSSNPPALVQTRKRSSTVTSLASSVLRHSQPVGSPPPPPLHTGDSTTLTAWVERDSLPVQLNPEYWPGIREGDLIRITHEASPDSSLAENDQHDGFLFVYGVTIQPEKHAVQLQFHPSVANLFGFKHQKIVKLTKVEREEYTADYIEIYFQDQYLGRSDMWRATNYLAGQCVHVEQKVTFTGCTEATVKAVYSDQKKVLAAFVAPRTKVVFRSLSAKMTIFIQVCRELWHFSDDGERYYEKLVHSFLPALFDQWHSLGTNHVVTIVLISRVYYTQSELTLAAGPLRKDDKGDDYKDFFKVIMDLEIMHDLDWKDTLVKLKQSLWTFQRDILLTHHYHRAKAMADNGQRKPDDPNEGEVPILGRISFAHEGPILEALNLALNPTEKHYIDRSLNLTGNSAILITPGTGYFAVSKHLLRLTTCRILDQGFGLDLVCLTKRPLHRSPVFSFRGQDPELRHGLDAGTKVNAGNRTFDPLWGGDLRDDEFIREKNTFYWEPFWICTTFWDYQMDLPMRPDRFVARSRMHEIQMMSLLEHDLLSAIEIPFLPNHLEAKPERLGHLETDQKHSHNLFDADIFSMVKPVRVGPGQRASVTSSGGSTVMSSSVKTIRERTKRLSALSQSSEGPSHLTSPSDTPRSGSPPQQRIRGFVPTITERVEPPGSPPEPRLSAKGVSPKQVSHRDSIGTIPPPPPPAENSSERKPTQPPSTPSFASKFTTSWFFGALRSATTSSAAPVPPHEISLEESTRPSSPPKPLAIKGSTLRRAPLPRQYSEEDSQTENRHTTRSSPSATPPRESLGSGSLGTHRRPTLLGLRQNAVTQINPSQPHGRVPYSQSSLAKRWQHVFPSPVFQHSIKWKSMTAPACLPLTVEFYPTPTELETEFKLHEYSFVVNPPDMRSFLVRELQGDLSEGEPTKSACALAVLRGMAAQRLAQGFQFVLSSATGPVTQRDSWPFQRENGGYHPKGASDILLDPHMPVYLSMSNEIHCLSYNSGHIQVKRYLRRMNNAPLFEYQCLVWPKEGDGYTSVQTTFAFPNLEAYHWNRLDMLVAGYEQSFNDSLRYWRTRFIVLPAEPPLPEEGLNEEEIRLKGADKLADLFSRARWTSDSRQPMISLRFVPTTLGPAACVEDDNITEKIDEVHATGPLQKKVKSERVLSNSTLSEIARAMREDDGVPIKNYKWHNNSYPSAFTGSDLVTWLIREYKDIHTREQAADIGVNLQKQGLFQHCRDRHQFLDGNYFYRLVGEFAGPMNQRSWFTGRRQVSLEERSEKVTNLEMTKVMNRQPPVVSVPKRTLLLSQTCIIDVDPNKRSDQAERVILHHDVIHNPANGFHFELQWLGTTAKCIQDTLKLWNRAIEKNGLRIVEAYVDQITDIREKNVFQSCLPIRLARLPPALPTKTLYDGSRADTYFECQLLKKFDFVLDVEVSSSERVKVVYSYRATSFQYSQYVHKSGAAFVQVIGGREGFRWLKNRLVQGERNSSSSTKDNEPLGVVATRLQVRLEEFCANEEKLKQFYEDALLNLSSTLPSVGHAGTSAEPILASAAYHT